MKLLLDTNTFLWSAGTPDKLSSTARAAVQDRSNTLILSIASAWEMQIKLQLGKLRLASSLESLIQFQQQTNGLQLLPIELSHVLGLSNLPPYHKDPFDRLIIAQALVENALLVSADATIAHYPVNILW